MVGELASFYEPLSYVGGGQNPLAGLTMPDWSEGRGQTKHSPTGPPGWGLGVGPITSPWKKTSITETMNVSMNLSNSRRRSCVTCRTVDDNFLTWVREDMTGVGESRKEAHMQINRSFTTPKSTVRIGTWNVRTMYSTGKSAQVVEEMRKYKMNILGISECRWTGFGKLRTQTEDTIIYSGKENEHQGGVAIIMEKETAKCLMKWNPVNDRIITARLYSKFIKTTIVQIYAPTNEATDEDKDDFYEHLQRTIDEIPKHDLLIIMGDWNAKIGDQLDGDKGIVGKHCIKGERNDNGNRMVAFCMANNLPIMTSMFPHKEAHKYTWTSPNGRYKNQIDHVVVNAKFRRSVEDSRAYRGADVASDHNLVMAKVKLKLNRVGRMTRTSVRYEVNKLKIPEVLQNFKTELRKKLNGAVDQEATGDERKDIETKWEYIKTGYNETAKEVIGSRQRHSKPWISVQSWKLIEERRQLKIKKESAQSERLKEKWGTEYANKDREVKRSTRQDKRNWADGVAKEAQDAAEMGQMKTVYEATRKLCNDFPKKIGMVKDKNGKLLTEEQEIRDRWKEHFMEVLNREEPERIAEIEDNQDILDEISTEPITEAEIRVALKEMKLGKAPGIDSITVELLRADLETTIQTLHQFYTEVWEKGTVPEDWKKGLIIKLAKKGDLTMCGNWRGITLLSVVAKVMGRVLITRIAEGIDKKLRCEQAGFRRGRSTTQQIFVLRNIVEQAVEWNANIYTCFVDFEKAFDSVRRETLWEIMRHYGIPPKLITVVKTMYEGSQCAVVDENGRTDWFEVKSGVKQGCNMSGFLFLLVIDWVMRKTTSEGNNGIRWNFMQQLDDLDFADDIALLSNTRNQMQRKLDCLNKQAKSTGLKINTGKTKVMRLNASNKEPITIEQEAVEDVDKFTYLGATVSKTGGAGEDMKQRIGKAWGAFNKLSKIWRSGQLTHKIKFKIFKSNVISVLLYGCETWKMTKGDEERLDMFLHKALRRILKIHWPMRITNEEIRQRANIQTISEMVKERRWKWIGHVLRMNRNDTPKVALTWAPEGRRNVGRPKENWRRTVEKERKQHGYKTWAEAEVAAQDRETWRRRDVHGPILHRETRK